MIKDGTTTGATAPVPTCGLTGCGVKVGKGGLCTGCRSVNYCSKEHQRRDWPSHKLKCRSVKKGETLEEAEPKTDKREATEEEVRVNLGVLDKVEGPIEDESEEELMLRQAIALSLQDD